MELRKDRKHTGVYMYVEKHSCQNYSDQPRLQLVYGVTVFAVSSLQGPGVRGMSLLERLLVICCCYF